MVNRRRFMKVTYFISLDRKLLCRQTFEMPDGSTQQEIEAEITKQMRRFDVEYTAVNSWEEGMHEHAQD